MHQDQTSEELKNLGNFAVKLYLKDCNTPLGFRKLVSLYTSLLKKLLNYYCFNLQILVFFSNFMGGQGDKGGGRGVGNGERCFQWGGEKLGGH